MTKSPHLSAPKKWFKDSRTGELSAGIFLPKQQRLCKENGGSKVGLNNSSVAMTSPANQQDWTVRELLFAAGRTANWQKQ